MTLVNPGPVLEQAQKCGRLKPFIEKPTLLSTTAIHILTT
jgi:hypothetical protein